MDHHNELLSALLNCEGGRALSRHIATADLHEGQVLEEPFELVTQVYFPYSGVFSFVVPLKQGHLVQVGLIGRNGVIGALQALESTVSPRRAVVQVAGRAGVIDAKHFAEVARQNYPIRSLVSRHDQLVFTEVQQTAACNAVHTVRQRVCRWILRLSDFVGPTVPLTQELLAGMIGVRRTTVTLAAASLQEEGIIEYRRGRIEIRDIERLKEESCECYQTLKDQHRSGGQRGSGAQKSETGPPFSL